MGLGVLEDTKLDQVPGTVNVVDDERRRAEDDTAIDPNLKYDTSGPVPIILVPQPSDDPNDPLNWSLRKRDSILFVLSVLGIIISTLSPLLAATSVTLALRMKKTFEQVARLTGWHLLGVALGGFLFVPSSRVWGKKHAFVFGTIIVIFSSVWEGKAGRNYNSHAFARFVQGIGLAPYEALVNACVGDMYFVHERGKRMALSNFAVFGGAFMTPVVAGKMAHDLGWEWTFYFVAILAGVLLPVLVFLVPETAYNRDERLNTDMSAIPQGQRQSIILSNLPEQDRYKYSSDGTTDGVQKTMNASASLDSGSRAGRDMQAPRPKAKGWLQSIIPFDGRKTNEPYWKLALRPLPLFLHPGILWGCLIQGAMIAWTVFIGIVLAAIMLGPPLFFNEVKTGYMYTAAFIGALAGFVIGGALSDSVPHWLAKKNRGVYEPEFRLPLVFVQLVLGAIGLYGFGITSANTKKYGWFWPDFFFAFEVAGMVVGAIASSTYVVDAHRNLAIEAFTCMMIFKNILSFGITWEGYRWLIKGGIKNVFVYISSVQIVICMLTIPLYIFGKRNRSYLSRHDLLKKLGLW